MGKSFDWAFPDSAVYENYHYASFVGGCNIGREKRQRIIFFTKA